MSKSNKYDKCYTVIDRKQHSMNGNHKLFGERGSKRITWDIITMCGYHCDYCYARKDESWGNKTNTRTINQVLNKIQLIDNAEVILMGGEPTLHPKYFKVLDELYRYDNVVLMGIVSNLNFKDSFIDKHVKYRDKFILNGSFHGTQVEDMDKLKATMKYINDLGIRLQLNVMLTSPNEDEKIRDIIEFCNAENIFWYFNMIFNHEQEMYHNLTKPYREWVSRLNDDYGFERENTIIYSNGNSSNGNSSNGNSSMVDVYNDIDIFLSNHYNYKGWTCHNYNYQINVASDIIEQYCTWKEVSIDEINNAIPLICKENICMCHSKIIDTRTKG